MSDNENNILHILIEKYFISIEKKNDTSKFYIDMIKQIFLKKWDNNINDLYHLFVKLSKSLYNCILQDIIHDAIDFIKNERAKNFLTMYSVHNVKKIRSKSCLILHTESVDHEGNKNEKKTMVKINTKYLNYPENKSDEKDERNIQFTKSEKNEKNENCNQDCFTNKLSNMKRKLFKNKSQSEKKVSFCT